MANLDQKESLRKIKRLGKKGQEHLGKKDQISERRQERPRR